MAFEILTLCIKEKLSVVDLRWIIDMSGYSNVENKIGKEYFNTIRERVKYIIKYSSTVNGKIVCKADSFIDRMIFIIAGLDNVYKNKVCAEFFCADEEVENDLIFSRKIYELLKNIEEKLRVNVEWERGAIMTLEEILAGESKNVEFKENLPEKSIKYMKSVVAFANGTGGKIIFGIADKTREVVGFDKEDVFKKMDAIANAVSDSCEPAIIPDISLQTIDGKTVIVAEISEGRQRPYYC